MNSYNIDYLKIENFENIKYGKFHYNYKTIDFMFNYKENSEKLLIIFHATIKITDKLPMFLKHNYEKTTYFTNEHSQTKLVFGYTDHSKK